jgi:RNA polymerase sigma-70 factor, ECF subfamily
MAGPNGGDYGSDKSEREAFARIYRCYADELFRFCILRIGDAAAAEEAMATVFLEAWRRRREVDFISKPARPWLYGVARNVLRNQQRAQRRREATVRDLQGLRHGYADDPSEELARRQATRALVGSLGTLPRGQREVVGLCLLGGRSYEAAAMDLKVPIGTVRSRLARARLRLAHAVRTMDGPAQPTR